MLAQGVLIHEIFHIILKKEPSAMDHLRDIASKPFIALAFSSIKPLVAEYYVEELFCDYASSWHLGPVFGEAFIKEIVYSQRYGTTTHPPRSCRALLIMESLKRIKYHPYKSNIQAFLDRNRSEQKQEWANMINEISNDFQQILSILKIPRYQYNNLRKLIREKYFQNNLPYVYEDVRDFFNNLPSPMSLPPKIREDYSLIISETLRKNVLKREFENAMQEFQPKLQFNNISQRIEHIKNK